MSNAEIEEICLKCNLRLGLGSQVASRGGPSSDLPVQFSQTSASEV